MAEAPPHARPTTGSGRGLPPVHPPPDGDGPGARRYMERLGLPGSAPFTRGVYPTMYRGRLWTMRQYAGFGSAQESNARFKYLLAHGTTGLSVAFDLPTQIGLDPDDPLARGEVGRVGVSVAHVDDMARLFEGIPLRDVSTSMTINAPAAVLLCAYVAVADAQGTPASALRGTVQNDILKEYVARGTYIFPPAQSLRLAADLIAYCAASVPRWNAISISGYHIREAGSTAGQELAFTLANAREYVRAVQQRGIAVDAFAPQVSFFFNGHNDFLEEIAKFRAARRLWARILRDEFGAREPDSLRLRFHTQTGGSTLVAQQPLNNVVRVAVQALAAVLGGTQSLHTNSYDEALGLPTERAARVALRTQQIIAHESGVANTIDPVAGSYTIEALTDALEAEAVAIMADIDRRGGMLRAIESGWVQEQIHQAAWEHQRQVEAGDRIVVGVNAFEAGDEEPTEVLSIDPGLEAAAVRRARDVRSRRDAARTQAALERLAEVARSDANVVPAILDAVRARATTGEICHGLRAVWGTFGDTA